MAVVDARDDDTNMPHMTSVEHVQLVVCCYCCEHDAHVATGRVAAGRVANLYVQSRGDDGTLG